MRVTRFATIDPAENRRQRRARSAIAPAVPYAQAPRALTLSRLGADLYSTTFHPPSALFPISTTIVCLASGALGSLTVTSTMQA